MDMRPDVEIHIDTLAIDGVSERAAARAGEAIRRELARLIAAEPLAAGIGPQAIDHLDAGALPVPASAPPAALGRAVAGAVHGGLVRR